MALSSGCGGGGSGRDHPPPRDQGDEEEPVEAETLQCSCPGGLGAGDGGDGDVEAGCLEDAFKERGEDRESTMPAPPLLLFRCSASPLRHAAEAAALSCLSVCARARKRCEKRQARARESLMRKSFFLMWE